MMRDSNMGILPFMGLSYYDQRNKADIPEIQALCHFISVHISLY